MERTSLRSVSRSSRMSLSRIGHLPLLSTSTVPDRRGRWHRARTRYARSARQPMARAVLGCHNRGMAYPAHREADVVLRDGSTVHVRPVRPNDEAALLSFFHGLSADSRQLRFFSQTSDQ